MIYLVDILTEATKSLQELKKTIESRAQDILELANPLLIPLYHISVC